jgi:penicillin-binding protein 2
MFYLPGTSRGWGDANRGGHGWTDLRKSITQSVNTYYYKLALDMGIDRFDHYMGYYGFGEPTGIDLTGEIGGILPSPQHKYKTRKERWYPGDTVNVSIGQGDWKVTPLQLVHGVSGIGNGQLRTPHLVMQQRAGFDADWTAMPVGDSKPVSPSASNLQAVREGMMGTMRPGGSGARAAAGAPYTIAGKTGTAQVISRRGTAAVNPKSLPMHLRHRSLFVGFAPAENPVIAVAIAVEGGGYGGSAAAPIARKLFDAWLLGKMPEGLEPLDSERGTTAIGITAFDGSDSNARAAGDAAAAALETLPVVVGVPPAPAPAPLPGAPLPAAAPAPTAPGAPERAR